MPEVEARARVRPIVDEVNEWALRRMAAAARAAGAVPVLLAMDDVRRPSRDGVLYKETAAAEGILVLNLYDLYEGQDHSALQVSESDKHPNASGHGLIARRLLLELHRHDEILALGLSSWPSPTLDEGPELESRTK
jgi:hypothetical protein